MSIDTAPDYSYSFRFHHFCIPPLAKGGREGGKEGEQTDVEREITMILVWN